MPLIDFMDASNRAQSVHELGGLFCRALDDYGYEYFTYHGRGGHNLDNMALLEMQPNIEGRRAWYNEYKATGQDQNDPLLKIFPQTKSIFTYEQLYTVPLTARQKAVMDCRKYTLMPKGTTNYIPLNDYGSDLHGMAIGTTRASARRDKDILCALFALANQFHMCKMNLEDKTELDLPLPALTPREKEIIQWCSQGKSNGVIAQILNISDKTVEFHMQSVFRKLNVTSRTSATLRAVQCGMIAV